MLLAVWISTRLIDSKTVQSDIFKIIPEQPLADSFQKTATNFLKQREHTVALLIKSEQKDDVIKASQVINKLSTDFNKPLYIPTSVKSNEQQYKIFFQALYPYRYGLLDPTLKQNLSSKNAEQTLRQMLQTNFSDSFSLGASKRFMHDPFGFFERYINNNRSSNLKPSLKSSSPYNMQLIDDTIIFSDGALFYSVLPITMKQSVFDSQTQQAYFNFESTINHQLAIKGINATLNSTGVLQHAAKSRQVAEREISTIGSLSLLGIIALFLMTLRSLKPIIGAILCLSGGLITATALTVFAFGYIHVLTLVFGATVIGIAIDYAFHFYAHQYLKQTSGKKSFRAIKTAVFLGLMTSVAGFSALLLTNFTALMQLATFAIGGLTGSFICVALWLSLTDKPTSHPVRQRILHPLFFAINNKNYPFYIATGVLGMALVYLLIKPLSGDDDIKLLRIHFPELEQTQTTIQLLTQNHQQSGFFLVAAKSANDMLVKQQKITRQLQQKITSNELSGYSAASDYLPSQQELEHNHQLINHKLIDSERAKPLLSSVGINQKVQQTMLDEILSTQAIDNYTTALPDLIEQLPDNHVYFDGEQWVGIITINSKQPFDGSQLTLPDQAVWYDKVESINQLFESFRQLAIKALLIAYALVLVIFCVKYGLKQGIALLLPAISGIVLTLALLSMLNLSINLFHILATLIVLAVGIDFSLFLKESKGDVKPALLATSLSACTTVLAFGLLAFSRTPALASFGLVIFTGIIIVYLLAPLTLTFDKQKEHCVD